LPSSAVTGATFYRHGRGRTAWLLLSLNLGDMFEVVSIHTLSRGNGLPRVLGPRPRPVIAVPRSYLNNEPEGLAITTPESGHYPLGGLLHWQMLPTITASTVFSRILTYLP
jgi:hypothetical protein